MTDPNRRRVVSGTVMALLVATLGSAVVAAHPTGVFKLASRSLEAGATVAVAGEKFPRGARLLILLTGVAGRVELGRIETDTAGTFTDSLRIPHESEPGAYQLVALASDGDVVGRLDVEIAPASSSSTPEMDAAERPLHDIEPSDEPLALDRAQSTVVTGSVLGGIVVALVLAGALLYRSNTPTR